jgi:hypothetical protein
MTILPAMIAACSEYDPSRDVSPYPPGQADSATVFLFSAPPAKAHMFQVDGDVLVPAIDVDTPRTLRLPTGDYVIHFSRQGYRDRLEGILLGPDAYREVSVTLDSTLASPTGQPPVVSIAASPGEIILGDPVQITVDTDGDVGILLPIAIFTTQGTYTDYPDHPGTVIYSFAAVRGGVWAAASDTVSVKPAPPADPDNAQALVFSNPRSDVEIFDIATDGELVTTGQILRTPFVIERIPGPVAFTFREPGYAENTRALLLGPGQVKELNVDLVPIGTIPPPPTVELSADPRVVEPGGIVTYSIRTTHANYSILFGPDVIASTESEWTWAAVPDRTRVTSAIAFGDGGVASDTTLVVVLTGPGEPDCPAIGLFPDRGVTTREPRVTLSSRGPIRIPEHEGPVSIRLLNQYSANIPGQEDEAFAVGLRRGDRITWARRPGDPCPVVPDPRFETERTIWVECGAVDVSPGDYDVVMWHVSTGEFACYSPNGNLEGSNSVNVQDGEVIYCRPGP